MRSIPQRPLPTVRMADYRRNEIVSGLFVVAALVVFMLFAFRVGDIDVFSAVGGDTVVCRTYLADVKTLDEGAKVTVAGRRVGTVQALRLVERPGDSTDGSVAHVVEVTFSLETPELRVAVPNATAALMQDGFLGRHYLAFEPGTWPAGDPPATAREAGADGVIEVPARPGAGLDGLVAAAIPIMHRVDEVLATVQQKLLSPEGVARVRSTLDALSVAVEEVRALLDREDPGGVARLILEPLNKLLVNLDTSLDQVRGRLLEETLTRAERLLDGGPVLVGDARRVLATVQGILDENRPQVAGIVGELGAATADLDQRLAAIEAELLGTLQGARGLLTDNRGELAEAVRRLRRTMWQAEMALRKIRANPAYLLFGDDEPDLEAGPVDHGELWRAGRARPYGQRDERGGGK